MKDKEQPNPAPAGTHQRSPNYPANSLSDAVDAVRKVFAAEKRTVLDQESVARGMGYGSLNGKSRSKVASLRKYGLVDVIGDKLQVSQLAMRILHQPEGSPEYLAAVREAALKPELIQQFVESHREASEQSIQSELILKRGFSPDGAKAFAKAFRETIVFAKLDEPTYSPPADADKSKADAGAKHTEKPGGNGIAPKPLVTSPMTATNIQPGELPVPIADGLVARVPFPMSEDDFELLIGTLQLWKKKLVRAVTPGRKFPAQAIWKNHDSDTPVTIIAEMGEQNGQKYYQSQDGTGIPGSELWFNS